MKLTPDGGDASKQTHYHRMETNKKNILQDWMAQTLQFTLVGVCVRVFFSKGVEMVHGKKSKMFLILLSV